MRKLVAACALCIFLFSCQKEIDPNIITGPGTGGGNGGGTSNPSNSYQPLTAGTWWKYTDSASGNITTVTVTNLTKTINSIVYNKIVNTTNSQTDTTYYASPQPNYYMTARGQSPNTGAPYDLTFHYLNDTASIGRSWNDNAGQGNGFTATTQTTMMEKNITVTIAGKTYTNVIHTQMALSYDLGLGGPMDFGTYDFYFAKGIGIIRIRANLGAFGFSIPSCSDLTDYHIQ